MFHEPDCDLVRRLPNFVDKGTWTDGSVRPAWYGSVIEAQAYSALLMAETDPIHEEVAGAVAQTKEAILRGEGEGRQMSANYADAFNPNTPNNPDNPVAFLGQDPERPDNAGEWDNQGTGDWWNAD